MLRALTLIAMLAFGLPLHAQSWEAVRGLKPGDRVKVTDNAGKEYQGAVHAVSGDAISLETRSGEVVFEKAKVRKVQVRSTTRRVRNLIIGAAIGVAVGVTVDSTLGAYLRNESGETDGVRALSYLAPIGIFGGIGAAPAAYATIYRWR